ncbi:MAG: D-TA family PLP-dependent enzyme [Acidobacteriota bacterium]|nr:D-TA family PLP-dependent enzyme [Acidobacteriota bacterium]
MSGFASKLEDLYPADYRIDGVERVRTPALAVYPEIVESNLSITLGLVGDDPDRLRPHVKTSKLAATMRRMIERGIRHFKCATTLELATLCELGAGDVLVAYPVVGANARRIVEIARQFPDTRVSVLVENADRLRQWTGSGVGVFIDVNPGMDRTGIEQHRGGDILDLAVSIGDAGLTFRGLHYYDGHLAEMEPDAREATAHRGYDRLMQLLDEVQGPRSAVAEIITAGTPAFPASISYPGFARLTCPHRVSPGTVVYGDCASAAQLPREYGYRPAALVVSTVVSHPTPGVVTCDAGHKTVSADAGIPTCAVAGRPDLDPLEPSEEHLPVRVPDGAATPSIGEVLYLVPRHVCPTVNNFDHALLVVKGAVGEVVTVTARGREAPL